MLVAEIRELLKKYQGEDLRLIVLEMYKLIPKKLREEKDIDGMLNDIHSYMQIGKNAYKNETKLDINILKVEIEKFIDYAYKQYYFAPNNFIRKNERSKWRFKVKSYIKDLQEIKYDGESEIVATELLKKLYEMLCHACCYYIFNTDDAFNSVGIVQTELLDLIITREFERGINKESVKSSIALIVNNGLSRITVYSDLIIILVEKLKSADSKETAIAQCLVLKSENNSKTISSKRSYSSDLSEFNRIEKINNLVEIIFRISIELCEYEKAIEYFNINNIERDKEISLYVLLKLLKEYSLTNYWLREFDEALKKGITPRDYLSETYKYVKENGAFPEMNSY